MIKRAERALVFHDFNVKKGWFYGSDESGFFVVPGTIENGRMLVFRPLEGAYGFHPAQIDMYSERPFETHHTGRHSHVKSKKRVYREGGEKDVVTVNARPSQSGPYRWISQSWRIQWHSAWECNQTTQDIVRLLIRAGKFYRRDNCNLQKNVRRKENGQFVNVEFRPITEVDQPTPAARSTSYVESLLGEYWSANNRMMNAYNASIFCEG